MAYALHSTFKGGHKMPINSAVLSEDCNFVASGGEFLGPLLPLGLTT
jgi:hypothetical protein